MAVQALFEVTGGIIRVVAADARFGDPFAYALYVAGDEGVATIKGMRSDGAFSVRHMPAIVATLVGLGFHEMRWIRHRAGQHREVRLRLSPDGSYRRISQG